MEQLIREASVHAGCYDCVVGIRIAANDPAEMFPLTVLHEGTNLSGWSVTGVSREKGNVQILSNISAALHVRGRLCVMQICLLAFEMPIVVVGGGEGGVGH
ncbi:hypothetical protein ACLKA7_000671 [Drosophila subpalustris]